MYDDDGGVGVDGGEMAGDITLTYSTLPPHFSRAKSLDPAPVASA